MPYPAPTPITVETVKVGGDSKVCETHASFGLIQASRTSGQVRLFGSAIPSHQHFISLSIARAKRIRTGLGVVHYARTGEVLKVSLSELQWAELITSLGSGDGVPCTIERDHNGAVPAVIEDAHGGETALQHAILTMREHVRRTRERVEPSIAELKELIEHHMPGKKNAAVAVGILRRVLADISGDAEHFLHVVQAETDRVVQAGQADLRGRASAYFVELGMAARKAHAAAEGAASELLPGPSEEG